MSGHESNGKKPVDQAFLTPLGRVGEDKSLNFSLKLWVFLFSFREHIIFSHEIFTYILTLLAVSEIGESSRGKSID